MAHGSIGISLGQHLGNGNYSQNGKGLGRPASAPAADVVVTWDGTKITTKNQLRAALQQAMSAVEGSDFLT